MKKRKRKPTPAELLQEKFPKNELTPSPTGKVLFRRVGEGISSMIEIWSPEPLAPAPSANEVLSCLESSAVDTVRREGRFGPGEERTTSRWYAAETVYQAKHVRDAIARNDIDAAVVTAFLLGRLTQEAYDAEVFNTAYLVGRKVLDAARGPRRSRLYEPLVRLIKEKLRSNRNATAAGFWKALQRYNDDYPLRVRGGEVVFARGKLRFYSAPYGDRTFSYKKFGEYFCICKNPPGRAE